MKALYPCEDNWDLLCEFYDRVEHILSKYQKLDHLHPLDADDLMSELDDLIGETERRIR